VRAAQGAHAIIDGGGTLGFVIRVRDTPNMTFQGLTIQNGATGIEFDGIDGGRVFDCMTVSTGQAVAFRLSSHGVVAHSKLEGSVYGTGSTGTIVEFTEIYGSNDAGLSLGADSRYCRYSHNSIHDNGGANIDLDDASNMIVDANLVYMTPPTSKTTVGILFGDQADENVTAPVLHDLRITNNIVIHNEGGIRFRSESFPGRSAMKNVTIVNNTVVDNGTVAIEWDAGPHQGSAVSNNIFAGRDGESFLLDAHSTDGVTFDHNLWFLPDVSNPFAWGSSTYDHDGWVAAIGGAPGDVASDPLFSGAWDLPTTNLYPSAESPATDAATSREAAPRDFFGASRPFGSVPDMGALELDGKPPRDLSTPPGLIDSLGTGGGTPNGGTPNTDGSTDSGNASEGMGRVGAGGSAGAASRTTSTGSGNCGCRFAPHSAFPAWALPAVVALARRSGSRRRRVG
jgi:hypothetical protein